MTIKERVRGHDPVENVIEKDALHDFAFDRGESNGPITAVEIFEFTFFSQIGRIIVIYQLVGTSPELKLLFRKKKKVILSLPEEVLVVHRIARFSSSMVFGLFQRSWLPQKV